MADPTLERATQEKLFQGILDAAGKSLERARGAGVLVQGAAAALGTLYTGILTFVFAAKDNPLPLRGFVPTVFFAAAVALAMFYTAYLTKPGRSSSPNYGTVADEELRMLKRADWYVYWTAKAGRVRQEFLRAGVVSLAVGVLFLPLPFIDVDPPKSTDGATTEETAEIEWPDPVRTSPEAMAAVLYEAQLAEFRESLSDDADPGESDEPSGDVPITVLALLVGSILVAAGAWGPRLLNLEE